MFIQIRDFAHRLIGKFPDIYTITTGNPLHQNVNGFFRRFDTTDDIAV